MKELTAGQGVPVVYDSIGRETFDKSLECLSPYGLMVLFGQSSGAVLPFDPNLLQRGSLYLTRPTLATYTANRKDLAEGSEELFSLLSAGTIQISINQKFALRDARVAHERLETRQTTGSTILIP